MNRIVILGMDHFYMQEASFMGVIRIILIILLVYYGVKLIGRLLAPFLMRSIQKKMEKRFSEQFEQYQRKSEPKHEEGETVIDKIPNRDNSSNKDVGEYVDYEEID